MIRIRFILRAVTLLLLVLLLTATTADMGTAAPADRPSISVPYAAVPPRLDMAANDPAWKYAATIDRLAPPLGAPAAMAEAAADNPATSTRVSLLWSEDYLWIRFQCAARSIVRLPELGSTPRPGAPAPKRDLLYYNADCAEMFLDPVGDGKAYIEIQVSPDNGVYDAIFLYTAPLQGGDNFLIPADFIKREGWFFTDWNLPGLQTAASIDLNAAVPGWNVIIAIPAKGLQRLPSNKFFAGQTLKANFLRLQYSNRTGEKPVVTNWAPVPELNAHHAPAGTGTLTLQAASDSPRN